MFALDRQHMADDFAQALIEHPAQPLAFEFIVEPGIERIDIDRQAAFAPKVVPDVFIAGLDEAGVQSELARERLDEALAVFVGGPAGLALVGKQTVVVPARLAIGAPIARQGPARQLFARVPLALAEMQEAVAGIARTQTLHEFGRKAALGGPQRIGIPFGAVAVVDRDEGRFAAHGQAHIHRLQVSVDALAQLPDAVPLRVGVRLGHARRFENPRDRHVMPEFDFAIIDRAGHGRGRTRLGCAGERDVPFPGQQTRGGI